ncbi:hypothetical protein CMV30_00800 [Nibricoccus aquaticus]|uniref:Uncharacterized protein n=1 Tax=Nibricoccus aquaticus TaxID=2576891 RepID=A0A290Q2I3_9BACT|nr:hypothetical protein CMV30_00800 [Nibricoccus aquaticus]
MSVTPASAAHSRSLKDSSTDSPSARNSISSASNAVAPAPIEVACFNTSTLPVPLRAPTPASDSTPHLADEKSSALNRLPFPCATFKATAPPTAASPLRNDHAPTIASSKKITQGKVQRGIMREYP